MAFVTDSNRPQPLWRPPPTACLTASGAPSEIPSLPMHPSGGTRLHIPAALHVLLSVLTAVPSRGMAVTGHGMYPRVPLTPKTPSLTLPKRHSRTPTPAPTAFPTASNRPPTAFTVPRDRPVAAPKWPPWPAPPQALQGHTGHGPRLHPHAPPLCRLANRWERGPERPGLQLGQGPSVGPRRGVCRGAEGPPEVCGGVEPLNGRRWAVDRHRPVFDRRPIPGPSLTFGARACVGNRRPNGECEGAQRRGHGDLDIAPGGHGGGGMVREGGGLEKWASVPGPLFCVRADVGAKGAATQTLA